MKPSAGYKGVSEDTIANLRQERKELVSKITVAQSIMKRQQEFMQRCANRVLEIEGNLKKYTGEQYPALRLGFAPAPDAPPSSPSPPIVPEVPVEAGLNVAPCFVTPEGLPRRMMDVMAAACEAANVTAEGILSHNRTEKYTIPRFIAWWLCLDGLGIPSVQIGVYFRRDHTTVLDAVKKTESWYLRRAPVLHGDIKNGIAELSQEDLCKLARKLWRLKNEY